MRLFGCQGTTALQPSRRAARLRAQTRNSRRQIAVSASKNADKFFLTHCQSAARLRAQTRNSQVTSRLQIQQRLDVRKLRFIELQTEAGGVGDGNLAVLDRVAVGDQQW